MKELYENQKGKKALLLGNEAIVRGAVEAGVNIATTYPGTPASEIGDCFSLVAEKAGAQLPALFPSLDLQLELVKHVAAEEEVDHGVKGEGAGFDDLHGQALVAVGHDLRGGEDKGFLSVVVRHKHELALAVGIGPVNGEP